MPQDQPLPPHTKTLPLHAQLEAILFFKAEPLSFEELVTLTKSSKENLQEGLRQLGTILDTRGIRLIETAGTYTLATAPEASTLITELTKEELSRDIGKAGLETLAIILYKGSVTRRDIDFIRGVNSAFIIRNLLVRGLIERVDDTSDKRQFRYRPTVSLLSHLGVSSVAELPEFESIVTELEMTEKTQTLANEEQKPPHA